MSLTPMDKIKWLFIIIIGLYAVALPMGANFGVIDDHALLDTVLSARNLDFFIIPAIGRFFPLNGQEYNIVSLFSLSPLAFYAFNMVEFVIVVFVMLKILELCLAGVKKKYLAYGIVLIMIFSPGFGAAWFRLLVPERGQVVFFLVFFLMFLHYQKEQKYSYLIIGLIAANFALYYKEPGFLMLGTFGFFHLVFGWKGLNAKQKLFDALIMVSAAIFILLYFFIIYLNKGPVSYGATPYNPIIVFAKNVFNYALSDPFLMVLMFGVLVYRFYEILVKKGKLEPVYDATLLAGAIYILGFLKLNISFSYHYLLPAYVFGTFGIVYFLVRREYFNKRLFKAVVAIALFLYVFNALPVAIHLISQYKNVPNNFQNTIVFLANYISRDNGKVIIYLDGVNRGNEIEVYVSLAEYLTHKGISPDQFDLKSDIPSNNSILFSKGDPKSPFTVFRDPATTQIRAGDLLLVTPYTCKYIDQKYLDNLKINYKLLYHSGYVLEIPNISLKSLIKYFMIRRGRQPIAEVILTENIFNWPDFYIFRKR